MINIMKSFFGWVKRKSVVFLTYAALLSAVSFLFLYKQQTLIDGQNTYETQAIQRINTYEYPWRNPVDAPIIAVSKLVGAAGISPLQSIRTTSAILMIFSVLMFYRLLKNWLLSPGKALVGGILFATSSWTIVLGRGGHTIVASIFLLLLVFTLSTRLFFTTRPFVDWLLLVIATGLALYTPLSMWIIFLAGIVWLLHVKQRQRTVSLGLVQKIIVGFVFLLIISPLIIGLILKPSYVLTLLGADNIVGSISAYGTSIANTVTSMFFYNQTVSSLGLGRLPFLDVFSVFMFLLGCYYFERRLALKRSKILFGGFATGIIVCSIGGYDAMRVSILLPLVYIFIAAGIHESISRWLVVFPKNPIARGIGVAVLSIAIGFVGYFHLSKTFIARPGNLEIRSLYQVK